MPELGTRAHGSALRTLTCCAALTAGIALIAGVCSSDNKSTASTTTATTQDPVAAAEARVATAEKSLDSANTTLTSARKQFCDDATGYVTALDRYGKVFTDNKATVGDVKTGGADLAAPRESVSTAATAVSAAQGSVASAEQELAAAQGALANAKATASSVPTSTTTAPTITTTTLVPAASVSRVKQAESDLATTSTGITDATPLVKATAAYNSAAFALEIAWLNLLANAGCLTAQQAQAVAQVTNYTVALQTDLQKIGYYSDAIDGVYGPQTVDAVKKLQTDSGLPGTGWVDQATALALNKKPGGRQHAGRQPGHDAGRLRTEPPQARRILDRTDRWSVDAGAAITRAVNGFQTDFSGLNPPRAVHAATRARVVRTSRSPRRRKRRLRPRWWRRRPPAHRRPPPPPPPRRAPRPPRRRSRALPAPPGAASRPPRSRGPTCRRGTSRSGSDEVVATRLGGAWCTVPSAAVRVAVEVRRSSRHSTFQSQIGRWPGETIA